MKQSGQMSVTLTPELEKLVRAEVEGGGYASNSEVIREALRARYRRMKTLELDAALDRGLADVAAGRVMPLEQAFSHIRAEIGLKAAGEG
jgi:antitoxin ParD1/3/4